ncbi:MAG: biosynthetic-type acetolactate synthase large subunit [Bacteroidales bacterium]|nr:biosynthetic-type acetolactate synthase large subunit [Bacteroidales bacterium]
MQDCKDIATKKLRESKTVIGSEAILLSLLEEGVEILFGYPGGASMPFYDTLHKYDGCFRHILTRHEQGAIHAAQGYARVTRKTGVCLTTSGPGATNLLTGLADAYLDSTPLVCLTGQVVSNLVGTDAFQETDILTISMAVTKWNHQITRVEEIPEVLAKAFYIANSGRPGPVLIDFPKDMYSAPLEFNYKHCESLQTYKPKIKALPEQVDKAAKWINTASKPMLFFGQGVVLSKAEEELKLFVEKSGMPAASTLLGLSALPVSHPQYTGMLGMHGNYAPNVLTGEADLVIAIGMRFDDRVTGTVLTFLKQARIIHVDVDPTVLGKIMDTDLEIEADAKSFLQSILPLISENDHSEWIDEFKLKRLDEEAEVIQGDLYPAGGKVKMGEAIKKMAEEAGEKAILVTDVGQHQMKAARYFPFATHRSFVTSGGLGTMGFGLPAAVGAQLGMPDRTVIAVIGDGGLQMTMQELITIAQEDLPVKILLLNNKFLGMVRQWQELFFEKRYASTPLKSPDFVKLAEACGVQADRVVTREELDEKIKKAISTPGSFLLEVLVEKEENVFPMVPPGAAVTDMILQSS